MRTNLVIFVTLFCSTPRKGTPRLSRVELVPDSSWENKILTYPSASHRNSLHKPNTDPKLSPRLPTKVKCASQEVLRNAVLHLFYPFVHLVQCFAPPKTMVVINRELLTFPQICHSKCEASRSRRVCAKGRIPLTELSRACLHPMAALLLQYDCLGCLTPFHLSISSGLEAVVTWENGP